MAKQRVQTQYASNQVRLTPQASRVDTYVQPARNDQISRALDSVTGSIGRKIASDTRKQGQNDAAAFKVQQIQVAEAAYANGSLGGWSKNKGDFSLADHPEYGPLLEIIHNKKIGAEKGLDIQSALYTWDAENAPLRLSDPAAYNEALDAKTLGLLKESMGPESVNAVGYASSIHTQVNAAANQLKSQQFSEYRTAQAALPLNNFLTQLGAGVNVAEIAAKSTPENRVALIGQAVNKTLQEQIATRTLNPQAANSATADYLITLAQENGDLDILNIAKTIGTGNGGFLWGIHSEKKKLVAAQRSIASQLDNDERSAYQKKQQLDQKTSTEYQEEAYLYYKAEGSFEGFEGTDAGKTMSEYDISKIHKRVAEFQESPLLTQEDYITYYDQFSTIPDLAVDRAKEILEAMPLSSMAEWRLAESAMNDVINKRGSVFTSEPFKTASSFIDHAYKIDPQSKLPFANVSTLALDEYHRSTAQFKKRVTSYITDQSVLDKDLKSLGADENLQGISIHKLDESVKYDLFKQAAETAHTANSTSLSDKTQSSTSVPNNGTVLTVGGIPVTVTQTGSQ